MRSGLCKVLRFCRRCGLELALGVVAAAACSYPSKAQPFDEYDGYFITPAQGDNREDMRYASQLYQQMSHRMRGHSVVYDYDPGAEAPERLLVRVDLDPLARCQYHVERSGDELTLQARDARAMVWLLYQFISAAAEEDLRLEGSDLPPALLHFDTDTQGDFPFEYRSIYSPTNADSELRGVLATDHVDYDWGLWGHNLPKVFAPGKVPAKALAIDEKGRFYPGGQLCMSSPELYKAYENYILDQWGEGDTLVAGHSARFSVMPLDNSEVCLCPRCVAAGNTPTSATGATVQLLRRLSERFPAHQFFMGAYSTTTEPPTEALPSNAGVIVSALSLPMRSQTHLTAQGKAFDRLVERWKAVTPRVYVWDYMRNFDDYLTPYPDVKLLGERFKHYAELGVKGVFLNGSGDDYATLDDLQTYLLASLMTVPEADVDTLMTAYLERFYPATGQTIASLYGTSEEAATSGITLPLYGGIGEAAGRYIDGVQFDRHVALLDSLSKKASPEERSRLNKLLTALAFTQLELERLPGAARDTDFVASRKELLGCHDAFADMSHYREAFGDIDDYLTQWEATSPFTKSEYNLLSMARIDALTPMDEPQTSPAPLTDGIVGFPTDYHTAWTLWSADTVRVGISISQGGKADLKGRNLVVGCLHAPRWQISVPSSVELWQDGTVVAKGHPAEPSAPFERVEVRLDASGLNTSKPFELRTYKGGTSPRNVTAIDEITL